MASAAARSSLVLKESFRMLPLIPKIAVICFSKS